MLCSRCFFREKVIPHLLTQHNFSNFVIRISDLGHPLLPSRWGLVWVICRIPIGGDEFRPSVASSPGGTSLVLTSILPKAISVTNFLINDNSWNEVISLTNLLLIVFQYRGVVSLYACMILLLLRSHRTAGKWLHLMPSLGPYLWKAYVRWQSGLLAESLRGTACLAGKTWGASFVARGILILGKGHTWDRCLKDV